MRTLILAAASAIALGIAGAAPLRAQTANTGTAETPTAATPASGQTTGAMQPAAPQTGTRMEQGMPSMSGNNQYNSSAITGTSARGDWGQTSQNGWSHGSRHVSRNEVRQIQQRLQAEGLYRGRIDGINGPETGQALSQFQQNNGLQVTGRLDRQTMSSLLGNNGPGYGSTTPTNDANGANMPPASSAGAGDQTNTPAATH
jgi:Putative peptidoglycan binding domain